MTLHVCLVNRDQIIVMSDRRLSADGKALGIQMTKAFSVICAEGRGIVAFTGLAQYGQVRTDQSLMGLISENVESARLMPAIRKISEGLGAWIDRLAIPSAEDRRLSVLIALWGYRADGRVIPHLWRISNYESGTLVEPRPRTSKDFETAHGTSEAENPVLAITTGQDVMFDTDDWQALSAMLTARKPRKALVSKCAEIMRAAALRPEAGGTIGSDFTVMALSSDPHAGIGVDWDVGSPTRVMHMGGTLDLVGGLQISRLQVEQVTETPWFVPHAGRNQPCPCGSGLKYKRCHGR